MPSLVVYLFSFKTIWFTRLATNAVVESSSSNATAVYEVSGFAK